jgi:hypothetical protein
MIDRFYARHLSAMMAPERVVGLRVAEKVTAVKKKKKSKKSANAKSRRSRTEQADS